MRSLALLRLSRDHIDGWDAADEFIGSEPATPVQTAVGG